MDGRTDNKWEHSIVQERCIKATIKETGNGLATVWRNQISELAGKPWSGIRREQRKKEDYESLC